MVLPKARSPHSGHPVTTLPLEQAPAVLRSAGTTPGTVAARPWAVRIEGVWKSYILGHRRKMNDNFREDVMQWLRGVTKPKRSGGSGAGSEEFWALKDVSLEIPRGETLGIIGRNGAGKSTLLKILSRITNPTRGEIRYRGRLASLLEVGTGFHRELSGRENIYLNGAILGMTRREIDRQFAAIVEFAGVEKFLDTAVKHYSSGMYVRLAFAVAAHLRTDILIVDEVLAVGDAEFQKKCIGKMGEVARDGRTVLFVSHNMVAVEALCRRAIWMKDGCVEAFGESKDIINSYLGQAIHCERERTWDDPDAAPASGLVRLRRVAVSVPGGTPNEPIDIRTSFQVEVDYENLAEGAKLNLSVVLYNEQAIPVFTTTPMFERTWHGKPFPKGMFRSSFRVPGDFLNDGTYRLRVLVIQDQSKPLLDLEDALVFVVHDSAERRGAWFGKRLGMVSPQLEWQTTLLDGVNGGRT
ncbi:ABC transporter ATP-binding protein [Candidatus Poribacteria bacterium]|nr:ABC transporter ATP-binding protein [Candidatus Poribacteria bacterium]